ncbi:hypothetical protein LLG95_18865 [bacterium]|nr:hypothetical protein [bacterium]
MIRRIRKILSGGGLRLHPLICLILVVSIVFTIGAGFSKGAFYYDFLSIMGIVTGVVVMLGCGIQRSVTFHPAIQPKYLGWLKMTPWNWRKPLPLGPAIVSWEDGFILVLMTLLFKWAMPPLIWCAPMMAYAAPCILVYSYILLKVEMFRPVYICWFVLGGVVWAASAKNPAFVIPPILVVYAVLAFEAVRSLRQFPWKPDAEPEVETGHYRILTGASIKTEKGFFLSPAWAVMVGWWIHAIMYFAAAVNGGKVDRQFLGFAGIVYAICMALSIAPYFRAYFENVISPTSFFGRFTHGPLVVPGYDGMRLLPLLALAIGAGLPFGLHRLGVPLHYNMSLCAVGELLMLASGPDPRTWHLTGKFRLQLPERVQGGATAQPQASARKPNELEAQMDAWGKKFFPKGFGEAFSGQTVANRPSRQRQRHRIEPTCLRVIPKSLFVIGLAVLSALLAWETLWPGVEGSEVSILPMMFFVMMGYGMIRARGFHPAANPKYLEWLKLTPWHPGKALPFGPVELVWEDLVAVAGMAMLAFICIWLRFPDFVAQYHFAHVAAATFGLTGAVVLLFYCFAAASLLSGIGRPGTALAIAALFGSAPLFVDVAWWIALLVAMAAIASSGLRRSIRDFPWTDTWLMRRQQYPPRRADGKYLIDPLRHEGKLSPMGIYLAPKIEMFMMARRTRVLLSLTIGWWVFVAVRRLVIVRELILARHSAAKLGELMPAALFVAFGFLLVFLFMLAGRVFLYYIYTSSPIGFWGRVFTLRWIIWGHDKPFFVMLGLGAVSIAFPIIIYQTDVPLAPGWGVSAAFAFAIVTLAGPSIKKWRLTGAHRAPRRIL